MFGIGPTELIVILVIALLVFGPKRLPELATSLGKGLAAFRKATSELNSELDDVRRAVEDETRDLSKAAAPGRRVSRGERVLPSPDAPAQAPPDAPADVAPEPGSGAPPKLEAAREAPPPNAAASESPTAPAPPPTSTTPSA